MSSHRAYRALLVLYPADFRREYGDDLVHLLDELAADRGLATARARVGLDLLVTVPRYRLEHLMDERQSTGAIWTGIAILSVLGLAGILTGLYPAILLFGLAVVLAVGQRSRLGRSLRSLDPDLRRHRFRLASLCVGAFAASVVGYLWALADDEISSLSLIAFNVVGNTALVAAVIFLILAMLTPKRRAAGT